MRNDYLPGTRVLTGVSWEWVGVGKESSGRNYWSIFWEVSKTNPEGRHVIEKAIFVPCLLVEGYVSKF